MIERCVEPTHYPHDVEPLTADPRLHGAGVIEHGADGLYEQDYRPELLARIGFRSNMVDAEAHGRRSLVPERVACLDGFSLILRRAFALGMKAHYYGNVITGLDAQGPLSRPRPAHAAQGSSCSDSERENVPERVVPDPMCRSPEAMIPSFGLL